MTTELPADLFESAYELNDELRDSWTQTVLQAEPSEGDREDAVVRKLGARGWGRLHQFRYFYGPGWGEGAGKPLSPRSLEGFHRFIEKSKFPAGVTPSLFLTESGHLALAWESAKGSDIEIEFTPQGSEFYDSTTDREESFSHADLPRLLSKLTEK